MFKFTNHKFNYIFWFFNKLKVSIKKSWYFGPYCFDITKGHGSIWIDTPFIEFKIKRNYKGHFIN